MSNTHVSTKTVPFTRRQDYLYDVDYTVSSYRDHQKALSKSVFPKETVIQPIFRDMFSTLRHRPPATVVVQVEPIRADLGMPRLARPVVTQVGGRDRVRFFKRPLVPYHPTIVQQLMHAKRAVTGPNAGQPQTANGMKWNTGDGNKEPLSKTVAVQTVYRESEAQTDPYSPEFVVAKGSQPEVLALSALSWGQGLPVSHVELDMIERARVKRAWEATLPKVVDQASFEKRLKMMEEMELREWQERELEIERLQAARLEILSQVVKKREDENEEINKDRLQKIWQRKLQERDFLVDKLQKKKTKLVRKLNVKRKNVEQALERRDIISEYAYNGSNVYVPLPRKGMMRENLPEDIRFQPAIDTSGNVQDLKKALNQFTRTKIKLEDKSAAHKSFSARREEQLRQQLSYMDECIQVNKTNRGQEEKRPLKYAVRIEKPVQRPPTPKMTPPVEHDEICEQAAILVQRLLRGRAAQIDMYREKQRRIHLIEELRTRQALIDNNVVVPETTLSTLVPTDNERLEQLFEVTIEGEFIGQTLDFLSKQLVRLREEQRIVAMVKLAERTRRMREAEESGRRQAEIKRQREEDERFRQVMKIHQETVESYLEEVVMRTIDETASNLAREQVRDYATRLNLMVDSLEQRQVQNPEMCVADLVSSFLIPEVEKEHLRRQIQRDQRQLLVTAHEIIYGNVRKIEEQLEEEEDRAIETELANEEAAVAAALEEAPK